MLTFMYASLVYLFMNCIIIIYSITVEIFCSVVFHGAFSCYFILHICLYIDIFGVFYDLYLYARIIIILIYESYYYILFYHYCILSASGLL